MPLPLLRQLYLVTSSSSQLARDALPQLGLGRAPERLEEGILKHWRTPYSSRTHADPIPPSAAAQFRNHKLVYRRYAGLFFSFCVDANDNELVWLEAIHLFVEVLGALLPSATPRAPSRSEASPS